MLRFTSGEKENLVKHQKVSKYYDHDSRSQISPYKSYFNFLDQISPKTLLPAQNRKK